MFHVFVRSLSWRAFLVSEASIYTQNFDVGMGGKKWIPGAHIFDSNLQMLFVRYCGTRGERAGADPAPNTPLQPHQGTLYLVWNCVGSICRRCLMDVGKMLNEFRGGFFFVFTYYFPVFSTSHFSYICYFHVVFFHLFFGRGAAECAQASKSAAPPCGGTRRVSC